jgi:DNA-binding SARP family transcriptional activator
VSLAPLELTCFGPPTARLGGREPPPEVLWPKHLGLLVYLALSPRHGRTRDHLLGLFWAERPQARARGALNETIRKLRRALGDARLESQGETVVLQHDGLAVDALRFDAAADRDPELAVALARGDFLEGFTVEDVPEFEDWAGRERDRYRDKAVSALVASGDRRLATRRFADARDAARRALAIRPLAEPAARLLIRAAALDGDGAGAVAAFQGFSDALAELGQKPSRGLVALIERVKAQLRPATSKTTPDPESPLVGRDSHCETAFTLLADGLSRGPRTLFLAGAPGMGRTRLLGECAARLALDGALVAVARPLPSDHDAPWSTLRVLMRAGLRQAPGLVAAPPDAIEVLGGLVPDLAAGVAPRAPTDVEQVAAALAAVIRAVAEETPIGLAIDDAHLADRSTLGALLGAVTQLDGVPFVLILTAADQGEHVPPELLLLRSEIGRRLRGATLKLEALGEADIRELVTHVASWCTKDEDRDRLTRRLAFETNGSPFFAVTLLRGLERTARLRENLLTWPPPGATNDSPRPFTLPDLVSMAVEVRLTDLDAEHQRVLTAASIGGLGLDLDLIAALTELPRARVEDALPKLERLHLVLFDGERYAFAAPLIAEVVRETCLTGGQRRTLRTRAVAALTGREDLESRVLRVDLRAQVEPGREAFEEAELVERAAIEAGSARSARRARAAAELALGRHS